MIAEPATGQSTTAHIRKRVMLGQCPAARPVETMQRIEMTEAGSVTSVVSSDVKPKPFKTRLPKFWVPPLGICVSKEIARKKKVFGSMKHSNICADFQVCLVLPVPRSITRCSAHCFSSGERNLAVAIESGRKNNKTSPQRNVAEPSTYEYDQHNIC